MALVAPGAVLAVARRPDLWPVALGVLRRTAAPGWWRHWPPLPRPPADYGAFRHQTMWGHHPDARVDGEQLVAYLEWCARMQNLAR